MSEQFPTDPKLADALPDVMALLAAFCAFFAWVEPDPAKTTAWVGVAMFLLFAAVFFWMAGWVLR